MKKKKKKKKSKTIVNNFNRHALLARWGGGGGGGVSNTEQGKSKYSVHRISLAEKPSLRNCRGGKTGHNKILNKQGEIRRRLVNRPHNQRGLVGNHLVNSTEKKGDKSTSPAGPSEEEESCRRRLVERKKKRKFTGGRRGRAAF